MGRVKPNKPRRPRPPVTASEVAAAYRCGHCRSETRVYRDAHGNGHVWVEHDDGCPVLSGALPSTPDTLRALRATQ